MLEKILVSQFIIFYVVCILVIGFTIYSLYRIDKKALINFIYGLLSILVSFFGILIQYFLLTPLNNFEIAIFSSLIAFGPLVAIFFIAKGINIFGKADTDLIMKKDRKFTLFKILIILSGSAASTESILTALNTGKSILEIVHITVDLFFLISLSYCLLYLFRMRKPYKGGLLYKVITNYLFSLLIVCVVGVFVLQIMSSVELQKIDYVHLLPIWKLILLNFALIPLFIMVVLSYRTINLFKAILSE